MKQKRHAKILELIEKYDVETQEDLCALLTNHGFKVTQATVSRDIRELKLSKIAVNGNRLKYISLANREKAKDDRSDGVFRESVLSVEMAGNILVIKTVSGMAMAVATTLDAMNPEGIVGNIAGDDTIFSAVRTQDEAESIMLDLKKIIGIE